MIKNTTSGGTSTKVVALGIANANKQELINMASAPQDKNVIYVKNHSSLPAVEERLRNVSCGGQSQLSTLCLKKNFPPLNSL